MSSVATVILGAFAPRMSLLHGSWNKNVSMSLNSSKIVGGIVLVGTHPWRNSAFDRLPPRPLIPIAHRPLISYSLSWLRECGIQQVTVCANRETQALERLLRRHVPDAMSVTYQEDVMPRGSAGAVRDAIANSGAEIFVVTEGTAIPNVDLRRMLDAHVASGAAATVAGYAVAGRDGNADLQVPSGIYVFSREALEGLPLRGFHDIKENLIPQLNRSGRRVMAYTANGAHPRVLGASSYLAANEWVVEQIAHGATPEGYKKIGASLIHTEAVVAEDAVFVGPVLVAPGARILSKAVLVGPSSIGREVTVGRGTLVSRSAIWRRSVLSENAVIDRCILADDTILPPNAHMFRAVMATSAGAYDRTRSASEPARDPLPMELLRRMGRLFGSGTWSRSPAAQ